MGATYAVYAEVIVDIAADALDRTYDYRIPPALTGQICPGRRVIVPFANRTVQGVVVRLTDRPAVTEVKEIAALIEESAPVPPALIQLADWTSERYLCRRRDSLRCVGPPGVTRHARRYLRLAQPPGTVSEAGDLSLSAREEALLRRLAAAGRIALGDLLARPVASREEIASLAQRGLVVLETCYEPQVHRRRVMWVAAGSEDSAGPVLTPRQAGALAALAAHPGGLSRSAALRLPGMSAAVLRALIDKGLVQPGEREQRRVPVRPEWTVPAAPEPTTAQSAAVSAVNEAIRARQPEIFLLYGATGSGKTEVYLRALERCLAEGRRGIVLVPEISLTLQTVAAVHARFPGRTAVLHSGLTLGERYDEWLEIASGRASVVIGARSAVFAPVPDLGLIVLDEEHETTYKQDDVAPRYHAREVAIRRGQLERAAVLLGSATPSLESFHRAMTGEFRLLELPGRLDGRRLPPVRIVDLREELAAGNRTIFSRALQDAVRDRLARGEQAILFLNRRGHSTFVLCRECGLVLRCPYCEVSLTHHAAERRLRCHYCGYTRPVPDICPNCKSRYIRYLGIGTQKIEEEAGKFFPGARLLRMDVDTTRRKGAHAAILRAFAAGEADILIGTQMVAKGLDFERVSLVGVVSADTALNLPDFRAAERTFQLLTQVAGRAGRGHLGGEVIIQTYNPEHYSIVAAAAHDFQGFFRQEIELRRELGYPPFGHLLNLTLSSRDEVALSAAADSLAARLLESRQNGNMAEITLLGPCPPPLARLRGVHRRQITLRGPAIGELLRLARQGLERWGPGRREGVRLAVDVDPHSML